MSKRAAPAKPAPKRLSEPATAQPPSKTAPDGKSIDWSFYGIGVAIFVLAFAVYSNTLSYEFTMDDPLVVSSNRYVQKGVAGLGDIFTHGYLEGFSGRSDYGSYRPLPLATYAIEKSLMGGQPQDHHLMQVLFYALACVLLYRFLRRFLAPYAIWLPLFVTVLFVVHPLHTEVVANIKSRDEVLAFIGLVLMQGSLLRYGATGALRALAGAVLAFALAVFSKESAVTAIALAPLTLYYGSGVRGGRLGRVVLALLPVVLIYFGARAAILDDKVTENTVLENTLLAADTLGLRLTSAFALLGKYYQLVVWPHPLGCDYSFNQLPLTSFSGQAFVGLAVTLALAGYAVYDLMRHRTPGGYGVWWFGLTFALTSNMVVLVGSTLAERFLFTPLLGLLLLVGWTLHRAVQHRGQAGVYLVYGFLAALALPCAVLTWQRNTQWVSDEALFEHQLVVAPNSARTYITLGNIQYNKYNKAKEAAEAKKAGPDTLWQRDPSLLRSIDHFKKAISIHEPTALTHYSLGLSLKAAGRYPEAVTALERSVQLDSTLGKPLFHLGISYSMAQRWREAQQTYEKVLGSDPKNLIALKNAAYSYRQTAAPDRAIAMLERALLLAPQDIDVLSQLIKVYRDDKKDMTKAIYYNEIIVKALKK